MTGRNAACGAASLAMANRATAAVASSASIKPRPPSRMPKKRPCSEACANSLTPLIRETQNIIAPPNQKAEKAPLLRGLRQQLDPFDQGGPKRQPRRQAPTDENPTQRGRAGIGRKPQSQQTHHGQSKTDQQAR